MPARDPPLPQVPGSDIEEIRIQLDGASWIIEGADELRYRLVTRRFIEDVPVFETICLCLVHWAGLEEMIERMDGVTHGWRADRCG